MPARPHATAAPAPGDVLLHPLAVAALALLLVNDHYLKALAPGLVTGKLSDFAGLAFFPVLLVAAWEILISRTGPLAGPRAHPMAIAVGATGLAFALAKTVPPVAATVGWGLGTAQWLLSLPLTLMSGRQLPPLVPGVVVVDPTDLVALLALAIPFWIGTRRPLPTASEERATLAPGAAR
jgi:hypothetical protein